MVTVVKSLVGTDMKYAQAQVRSLGTDRLRLQIATGGDTHVELDFDVSPDVYKIVNNLLAKAVEANKPAVDKVPDLKVVIGIPLTLEDRVAAIEGFLNTVLIAN